MLSEKQIELARTDPKAFFEQFKLLRTKYENELSRVAFWQNCDAGTDYCKTCIERARKLVDLEAGIVNVLDTVKIKEDYRLFLHLRFISGLSMPEISAKLGLTRRWLQRLQNKALSAFAQAV